MRACLFNTARRSSYLLCGYTQRVARVCATACPSLRHFIKVIIVLIVLLLSPVVTEAGFGSGHAVIGRDDPPPPLSRCFRSVRTRMRSDPSLLIFYLLPKPKMAPVNVSVP